MKKLHIAWILVMCISLASYKSPSCINKFTGKWKYNGISEKEMYVVRTLEKQYEYIENGQFYYEFDIKWLNECKYDLTYVGTTSPKPAVAKIGEHLTVEILEISRKAMKYKTQFRNETDIGEMKKIK